MPRGSLGGWSVRAAGAAGHDPAAGPPTARQPRSVPHLRSLLLAARVTVALVALPLPASAQLSEPCGVTCGLTLGATGFTFATGALVAYGRQTGGISTIREGLSVWGVGLGAFVAGGVALSGNGGRQERAVYSAGIGTVAGSLLGLTIESLVGESSGARKLAATLTGAAAGALIAGVYGAVSYEREGGAASAASLGVRIPF